MRHRTGTIAGYVGLALGLLALVATTSEGTPFSDRDGVLLLLGFVLGGYTLGWLLGPVIASAFPEQ
ncbi:MAG TPA: hypothetical protein VFT91_08580 [Dehalococcoidia bacterium]|nr:hypothetical protein [Dehalococcoidia bacterium]